MSDIEKPQAKPAVAHRIDGVDDASASHIQAEFASYFWSAPLPRPEVLAGYNNAFPGCAERIVAMAETQAAHRQQIESAVINGNVYSQKVGLWLGFILAFLVISSGVWLVYAGRIAWGAGFIGVPLITLVSIFVLGKRDQNRQLAEHQGPSPTQSKLPFPE